ncbi:kinesin-like protein KIF18A [Protopterus annectens]|uniref:kinesin-like protein KIF18A n=1 Tax=Protopterus annectens TaxID=7888 RepID=UPI001CFB7B2C|nr:kinesin-like protein KIF18A [Protopterus annectens]
MKTPPREEDGNVSVVVRVRPPNQREREGNHRNVVQVVDSNMLVFDPEEPDEPGVPAGFKGWDTLKRKGKDLKFMFDRVFGEQSTQQEVFEFTTKGILDGVLDGYNCSVFAYGATGAGKTHTMLGTEGDPGVMYRTMMELYRRIEEVKEDKRCEVTVSYLEVYNEQIHDLLEPKGSLAVREDPEKGVVVQGLSFHQPKSAEQILTMLADGNKHRTQHPTDMNATSSRSHAVFQIYVKQQDRIASINQALRVAKMSLIDLAGSERASTTNTKGERLREGANINRSLLALINVINALADCKVRKSHIPYRDSKLTRLLKDSIGGNCRTVMIAAISPSAFSYDDTYNTLKYANRAKEIKLSVKSNVVSLDCHISKYAAVCEELRLEVSRLREKLKKYEENECIITLTPKAEKPSGDATVPPELQADVQENLTAVTNEVQTQLFKETSSPYPAHLPNKSVHKCNDTCTEPSSSKSFGMQTEVNFQRFGETLKELFSSLDLHRKDYQEAEAGMRELALKTAILSKNQERCKILCEAQKISQASCKIERSQAALRASRTHLEERQQQAQLQIMQIESQLRQLECEMSTAHNRPSDTKVLHPSLQCHALESENADLKRQITHLTRLSSLQERDQDQTEKLVTTLLQVVRKQHSALKNGSLMTPNMASRYEELERCVQGKKTVVWADQLQEWEEETKSEQTNKGPGSSVTITTPTTMESKPSLRFGRPNENARTKAIRVPRELQSANSSQYSAKRCLRELIPPPGLPQRTPTIPVKRRRSDTNTPSENDIRLSPECQAKRQKKCIVSTGAAQRKTRTKLFITDTPKMNPSSQTSNTPLIEGILPLKYTPQRNSSSYLQPLGKPRTPLGTSSIQNAASLPIRTQDKNATFDLPETCNKGELNTTLVLGPSVFSGLDNSPIAFSIKDGVFLSRPVVSEFTVREPSDSSCNQSKLSASATRSISHKKRRSISSTSNRSAATVRSQSRIAKMQGSTVRVPVGVQPFSALPSSPQPGARRVIKGPAKLDAAPFLNFSNQLHVVAKPLKVLGYPQRTPVSTR